MKVSLFLLLGALLPCDALRLNRFDKFRFMDRMKKRSKEKGHGLDLSQPTDVALFAVRGGSVSTSGDSTVKAFLNAVDLFGTGVFAFSGAVTAGKKGMDLLGMLIISIITSIGGGTIRDLLLDSGTVFWMRDTIYFKICVVVTVATFLIWPKLEKNMGWKDSSKAICTADAFGLGAFAILGTQKAADMKLAPIMWIVSGLITSTFGGVTRDVLCLQQPRIMYPNRTLYAAHPLLGSTLYTIFINKFHLCTEMAAGISFLVVVVSRILSFEKPLRMPHWTDRIHE